MKKVVAKFPFQGTINHGQLSFPVGAVIVLTSPDEPSRNGWIHGNFQGGSGWFPESHVEPVVVPAGHHNSMPPPPPPMMAAPPPPPTTSNLPEANMVGATTTAAGGDYSSSAPPVVASAIPIPDSTPATASIPLPTTPTTPIRVHKPLNERQISQLTQQGYTRGLALSLNDSNKTFAKRMWIVDNSGSMQKTDGHRLVETGRRQHVKFVECSRWEEITECVSYHIQLAALLHSPTSFRLLNDPGIHVGPQQFTIDTDNLSNKSSLQQQQLHNNHHNPNVVLSPGDAIQIIKKTRPGGCTPLTQHILAIHSEIESMVPQLRAQHQKVAVVIATDGLPTDDQGYGGKQHQDQFVSALRLLEGLPVWVVIRLCTDEEDVVEFYNDLDQLLELNMEVLDDFCGEAAEVHACNPWVNYALPLHRMREMGFHDRVFDMLDERRLTKSELRDFCGLLLGDAHTDGMPDPSLDWEGFLTRLDKWLKRKGEVQQQWDPMKKKLQPWLDLRKMNHAYGDGSCIIL